MPDRKSKIAWERENVISINIRINCSQTPELFALL